MESQSRVTGGVWREAFLPLASELAPLLVAFLVAVQALAAVAILARRLAGAVGAGSSPTWLLAWVILVAVLAAVARAAWFGSQPRTGGGVAEWLVILLPLAALLTTTCALSGRGASAAVVALAWLIPMAEEALTLQLVRGRPTRLPLWRLPAGLRWSRRGRVPADHLDANGHLDGPSEAQPVPDDCVQRINRMQTIDGRDVLSGVLATRFLPGQAIAHVHVAFCPPFAQVPRLEYRQISGPAARIKLGQLLPHGARFDLKLTAADVASAKITLEVRAAHEPRVE